MPRKRRTAQEARKEILDATEKLLDKVGPGGIRLQEVAAQVGVSHPAILHHFGSREGLVDAVIKRSLENLEAHLVRTFAARVDRDGASSLVEDIFGVLGDGGHARLIAWLILSGHADVDDAEGGGARILQKVTDAIHALRVQARGENAASREDTLFAVMMAAFTMFAEGVGAQVFARNAGLGDDPAVAKRFRGWFAELLLQHLKGQGLKKKPTEVD
jgi:AcrR family transcriptional regulator